MLVGILYFAVLADLRHKKSQPLKSGWLNLQKVGYLMSNIN